MGGVFVCSLSLSLSLTVPIVSLSSSELSVSEGDGTVTLTVTRQGDIGRAIEVELETTSLNATGMIAEAVSYSQRHMIWTLIAPRGPISTHSVRSSINTKLP